MMAFEQETFEESEMLKLLQHMDSDCIGDVWKKTVLMQMESRLIFVAECLAVAPPYPEEDRREKNTDTR